MRDVVKTNVTRNQNSKRTRRRRKNMSLYFFLVILLVIGIGIALSMTLFFNIKNITVKGKSDYHNEDIIKVSGIHTGDNMVRLDSEAAASNILKSMIYIQDVNINKKFPDTLEIEIIKCIPYVNIKFDEGYLIVSQKGKILEQSENADENLLMIEGFEPSVTELGKQLTSVDKVKDKIYTETINKIREDKESKIISLDMTDKYDITVNYQNRIYFDMGNSNDISYKLGLADKVLDKLKDDKEGYMTMIGTNQISFKNKSDSKKGTQEKIPINDNDMPDQSMIDSMHADDNSSSANFNDSQ